MSSENLSPGVRLMYSIFGLFEKSDEKRLDSPLTSEQKRRVNKYIRRLPEREQKLISRSYNNEDNRVYTLREVILILEKYRELLLEIEALRKGY